MKAEIERALAPLVGLPLSTTGRALNMAMFGFGPVAERAGRHGPVVVAEQALHIQEAWRITGGEAVVVGTTDWTLPPSDFPADGDFRADEAHRTRQDELVDRWFAHGIEAHTVLEVIGFATGDFRMRFSDGCVLETFVNQGTTNDDEYWRLLPPREGTLQRTHFVVTASGTRNR